MNRFLSSAIGRLRLLGFLEGMSFLLLVFVAMPFKYLLHMPAMVQIVGAIHGGLFVLFVLNTMSVSISHRWKFMTTTWKVLIGSILPFGTFWADAKILKAIHEAEKPQA